MQDSITDDQVFEDYEDSLSADFALAGAKLHLPHCGVYYATTYKRRR